MPEPQTTLAAVSDGTIAGRIAAGPAGTTEAEEAELYRRFAPRVRLYGRRHLRDEGAAEDLAQDVMLRAVERLRAGEVQCPEEIGSFILGTSRLMAQGQRRTARRREALVARFAAPDAARTSLHDALDVPRLAACLGALPDRDRLVLVLTYYAERQAPRIAEDLAISPAAVRVIRHRAMARLRDCVLGGGRT